MRVGGRCGNECVNRRIQHPRREKATGVFDQCKICIAGDDIARRLRLGGARNGQSKHRDVERNKTASWIRGFGRKLAFLTF